MPSAWPELAQWPQPCLLGRAGRSQASLAAASATSFMEYAHRRFGISFMTALHRGDANGLAGLRDALAGRADAFSVPAGSPELTFEAQWNVEEDPTGGWDFTFVQVSTDGGLSYRSIACTSSRSDASPHARPVMHANFPGYTGYSGGWRSERCGVWAFAGREALLAFRHVTDGSVAGDPDDFTATIPPGCWLRNLTLAGVLVSDGASLGGWLPPSQANPTPVHAFTVQLVAYSSDGQHGRELARLLGKHGDVVGAVVMYDEPTERISASARYRLTVNGVLQPGG